MEVVRGGRSSTGGRETRNVNPEIRSRVKLVSGRSSGDDDNEEHPGRRSLKMQNKVQVVYYLTRNGHLEHPHYLEVSHLATQPLRLRDVIERLTVLRGKAMACHYSWSCKRSYKNGYVWNDLSENDIVYASEGSEYVLKGSQLLTHTDFSDNRSREVDLKERKIGRMSEVKFKADGHSFRQTTSTNNDTKLLQIGKQLAGNNDEDDDDMGSCNIDESYSLPSTSSTNSDKQPPPPPPPPPPATPCSIPSKKMIMGDGGPSGGLARNTILMQLIACGGGSKPKPKPKPINPNNNSLTLKLNSMRSSIMPCLKHQLSSRGAISMSKEDDGGAGKEEEDEDMMMVRYISENPRFGNLQSEEKEYFSGTIVETMSSTTRHQHTPSCGPVAQQPSFPIFTKSSSYNEQRSSKSGLQAAVEEGNEKEKDGVKVKGMIIKCIPRRKSCGYKSSSKANKV